jgi:hypothetical protein
MTNLPAPYIFDMPLDEVEAGLELILRREGYAVLPPRQREAVERCIFEHTAQEHFMQRVKRVPKEKLGRGEAASITFTFAQCLASAAKLTPTGEMEVKGQSLTAMTEVAGRTGKTFTSRLPVLEKLGLIETIAPGRGNGRPYHIRLRISADHKAEIRRMAQQSVQRHFELIGSSLIYG